MFQADSVLNQVLNNGFAGASPQLLLLLEEKPLTVLLDGVRDQDFTLDEPGRIGDYDCYRVRFSRSEGTGEYWIDEKTFVLRQMRFRQATVPPGPGGEAAMDGVSMVANFERARLGGAINDPSAFKVEVPEGVQCHRALMDPGPYELIGKKVPDFQLADMQGKPWSSHAMGGKVVALHLWRSNAEACLPVIPSLQQAYDKFKENEKVAVWAINLDSARSMRKRSRIRPGSGNSRYRSSATPISKRQSCCGFPLPATFFVDSKGILQDCIVGDSPLAAAATTGKLEKLLGGEELAGQAMEKYQQRLKEYEKEVDLQFSGERRRPRSSRSSLRRRQPRASPRSSA